MATWIYNTVFGSGPRSVQIVSSGSSQSASLLPAGPPPSYETAASRDSKQPVGSGSGSGSPLRRLPLELPTLGLLRKKRVILASASPRRRQLLQLVRIPLSRPTPTPFNHPSTIIANLSPHRGAAAGPAEHRDRTVDVHRGPRQVALHAVGVRVGDCDAEVPSRLHCRDRADGRGRAHAGARRRHGDLSRQR